MKYAQPLTQELSVIHNGATYKKTVYLAPITITGVVDETYPIYDATATYNTGDYVIVDELKTIYRCTADNTSGVFPPSDPSKWVDYGFVNSYKMLSTDEQIGSKTEGTNIIIEIPFNRCDTIALINSYFPHIVLEQIDNDTNTIVITKNVDGRDIGCLTFAEYFYNEIREKTRIIITGLEWLPNSTLRLIFTGNIKIGSLIIGLSRDLGITLMGTELRFEDKSKIINDDFTNTRKVIRYGHVRVLKGNVLFDINNFDLVAQQVSEIIGKNILFIPDETDNFSEMTNIAYIEEFNMPVENPVKFNADITLVGVVE